MQRAGLEAVSGLQKLRSLSLACCMALSADDFIMAFENKKMVNLRKILLACPGVDDRVMQTIARNCPDLTELSVSNCNHVSNEGVRGVLIGCKNLRKLKLYLSGVTMEAFRGVVAPSLREFSSKEQISVEGLAVVMPQLSITHL
jgi:hypothetical protein